MRHFLKFSIVFRVIIGLFVFYMGALFFVFIKKKLFTALPDQNIGK